MTQVDTCQKEKFKVPIMFASTSTALKLHNWDDDRQLQPVSVYKPKAKPSGSTARLAAISWCHDNGYIAALQTEGQPQILSSKDRTNLSLVHTVQAVKRATSLSFKRHTKRTLVVGTADGEVVLYDTKNRNVTRRITSLGSPVRHLELNCTDERLAVATDRSLCIFADADGVNNFAKEAEHPQTCSSVAFHPNHPHLLAAGTTQGAATLSDLEKDTTVATWREHSAAVTGVSFDGRSSVVVTSGLDRKVCVFDHSSSESIFRMSLHQPVTASALDVDGNFLAVGLEDGYVYVYDLREPLQPLASDKSHSGPVTQIAFERGPAHCRDPPLSDRPSATTLMVESDYGENISETADSAVGDVADRLDGRLKRELLKSVKAHVGYLEGQLAEHCAKFQLFVNNEFDAIHGAMARWDVFNVADTCDGVAEPVDAKSVKSTSNK